MQSRFAPVVLGLLALTLNGGCVLRGPEDLRRDLARAAGVELHRDFGITLGRVSTWIARKAVRIADDPEIPSLRGLRRVQVGVYEVRGLRRGVDRRRRLDLTQLPAWQPIVQVHDQDEDVFVLVQEDGERIRGMLVVVAEDDEWVLVRMRGKLDRIVEEAMQLAFEQAQRSDLYPEARRQTAERRSDGAVSVLVDPPR